ncbi:MAG: HAD family hydrolase, partial [Desulfobacterales bacterium]|nr:HAD family hydrolase [Desulfobacterales bacterium]
YAQNRSLRGLYSEEEFPNIWKENAGGVYQEHTDGKLSFKQRQREGVKAIFKNTSGESEIDAILNDYLAVYEENWQLYYDVLPMLAKYKDVPKGIISNGDTVQQRLKLSKTGIDKYFETIIISGDVGICKPDLRIFLNAAEQAGMEVSQCWYVGDKILTGAKAAMDAGMTGIWLNRTLAGKDVKVPEIISLNDLIYSTP